jgi:lysine 2,3-aminomutase
MLPPPRLHPRPAAREWKDWRWQLANRITSIGELGQLIVLSEPEWMAAVAGPDRFPMAITPYYLGLVDPVDPAQAIRRCVVPTCHERVLASGELEDPLAEERDSPVPGLVHRYPDRVLLLATNSCSTYCRYCTRSRLVGRGLGRGANRSRWEACLGYVQSHPEVRDVLISGGDPLTLTDEPLEWLLARLRQIPHVELVRIGTKVPAVLPQRVTPQLVKMLRRFRPLWISIHATHPDELTPETSQACCRIADAGIPMGSQTVLLKGVNDDVETMKALFRGLMRLGVRPYYLYQCDAIRGSAHFRTPVTRGLEIMEGLRGHTTGYAVPTYVIDAPGGGGKIPLLPEYRLGKDGADLLLRNYAGGVYRYTDQPDVTSLAVDLPSVRPWPAQHMTAFPTLMSEETPA